MTGAGDIEISIGSNGQVHIAVLTETLLEVAAALAPDDADVARRLAVARQLRSRRAIPEASAQPKEQSDGAGATDS